MNLWLPTTVTKSTQVHCRSLAQLSIIKFAKIAFLMESRFMLRSLKRTREPPSSRRNSLITIQSDATDNIFSSTEGRPWLKFRRTFFKKLHFCRKILELECNCFLNSPSFIRKVWFNESFPHLCKLLSTDVLVIKRVG